MSKFRIGSLLSLFWAAPAPLCLFLALNALPLINASEQDPLLTSQQLQARSLVSQGVEAFKNGQYDEASQDFLRAKQLDPKLLNARLYLATAHASQYVPGAPSDENIRMGRAATEEFRGVLSLDAQNISAMDGLGSLLFQMAGSPFDADLFGGVEVLPPETHLSPAR